VWFENDDSGGFTEAARLASLDGADNVMLVDTDGDGDPDGNAHWLLNY
jgi:hypothetical protein